MEKQRLEQPEEFNRALERRAVGRKAIVTTNSHPVPRLTVSFDTFNTPLSNCEDSPFELVGPAPRGLDSSSNIAFEHTIDVTVGKGPKPCLKVDVCRHASLCQVWLTPRLSCGARAQPPSLRRPPARRQLQPVVRRRVQRRHFGSHVMYFPTFRKASGRLPLSISSIMLPTATGMATQPL